jgi:hypothetical protein
MAEKFAHESRFRGTLRAAGVPDKAFNVRQAVRELQIDVDTIFDTPPELFGPLAGVLVGRRVLVEHESDLPTGRSARRMLMKLLAALDDHDRSSGQSPPVLVALCRCGPGGLRRLADLRETQDAGILRGALGFAEALWVVDGRKLAPRPGYAGLRFMLRPDRGPTDYLVELLGDPCLPMIVKYRLEVATMNHEIPASEGERLTAWERASRDGEARGRRAALLGLAVQLVGPAFAAELESLDTVDAIERALTERLAAR